MAGYSGRPLVAKLGIKPGTRIAIVNAPRGYRTTLGRLPPGVRVAASARGSLPFIQFFTTSRKTLEAKFAALVRALAPDGALWVSWPKRASGGGDRRDGGRGASRGPTPGARGREGLRRRRGVVGTEAGPAAQEPMILCVTKYLTTTPPDPYLVSP